MKSLAADLKVNTSLEVLDIRDNKISDTGALHVAEALRRDDSLKKLDLYKCGISDQDILSLGEALKVNTSLEELQLMWNSSITDSGVEQFVLCLQENDHLINTAVGEYHLTPTVKRAVERVNQTKTQRNLPLLEIHSKVVDIMEEP